MAVKLAKNNRNLLPIASLVGAIPFFIAIATVIKRDDKIACYNARLGIHYTGGLCGLRQDLGGLFGYQYAHLGVAFLLIAVSLAFVSFLHWFGRETK